MYENLKKMSHKCKLATFLPNWTNMKWSYFDSKSLASKRQATKKPQGLACAKEN
jgi:hypothetical protein